MTVYINGTTGYSGPVGTIGDLTTTGNTTLGDAAGDTLTLNGSTTTLTQGTANGVTYLNGSKVLTTGTTLVFDGSNLGVGVTPSAWSSGSQALQNQAGALFTVGSGSLRLFQNAYYNGTNNVYVNTAAATGYIQTGGQHQWFNAPSGTVGTTATFTQAMTLDASGKLGIGVTSNLTGLLNFPEADSGEVINIYASATASSRSGIGKYTAESRSYAATDDFFSWYTGGPSGTKRLSVNKSYLDTFSIEQRFPNTGYGVSWFSAPGGVYTGPAASRIYDNTNLRVWTDDEMHFDVAGTTATSFWKFNSGVSSTGTGATTLFTLSADGNMYFADSGATGKRGIQGLCAVNDYWFIGGGGTASNSGYLEIATGDDGQTAGAAEPIYVSQYGPGSPLSGTLVRRASLLDANGNTSFPGTLTTAGATTVNGYFTTNSRNYAASGLQLSGTFYLAGSGATYDAPTTGYRFSEGYGVQWISGGSVWHHQLTNSSYIAGFGAAGANYGSGNCYLTGTLSQNYSDIRLKNDLGTIENALDKVLSLRGFRYTINELGKSLGFNETGVEAGLAAQDVQAVLPEAVMLAGSDMAPGPHGTVVSKSGENYLTLRYDRIVPLLVEAIKELKAEFDAYKLTHP